MSDKMVSDERFKELCEGPPDLVKRLRDQARDFYDIREEPDVYDQMTLHDDLRWQAAGAIEKLEALIANIKGALDTAEDGANLVHVARDAHKAELEYSALVSKMANVEESGAIGRD